MGGLLVGFGLGESSAVNCGFFGLGFENFGSGGVLGRFFGYSGFGRSGGISRSGKGISLCLRKGTPFCL